MAVDPELLAPEPVATIMFAPPESLEPEAPVIAIGAALGEAVEVVAMAATAGTTISFENGEKA